MAEMGCHPAKMVPVQSHNSFLHQDLQKSCDFTRTIFVQCENPGDIAGLCSAVHIAMGETPMKHLCGTVIVRVFAAVVFVHHARLRFGAWLSVELIGDQIPESNSIYR